MRVWLIHPGELLPVVDKNPRLFRYSYFAQALVAHNHKVVRFAPTFAHATKRLRAKSDMTVQISSDYQLQLLHAGEYRNHRSFARFRFYQRLAAKFTQRASRLERPDVIVCGIPTPGLCRESLALGKQWGVPVVLDVRDLWPDVYLNLFPDFAKALARRLLARSFERMGNYLAAASGRIAVSRQYLDWAVMLSGKAENANDRVIYIGSSPVSSAKPEAKWLSRHGIRTDRFLICFAGQFEATYDIDLILAVAEEADRRNLPLQILMAGIGSESPKVAQKAAECSTLVHLGWLNRDELHSVLRISDAGLCSYAEQALQSLPNKPFEYMAAGLVLINSLPGELADLVNTQDIGVCYQAGQPENLLHLLEEILQRPDWINDAKRRAHQVFVDHFSVAESGDTFVAYLEAMCLQPAIGKVSLLEGTA